MRKMKKNHIAYMLIAIFLLTGCQQPKQGIRKENITSYTDIAWISLLASYPLLDVDHDGNSDGAMVIVYMYRKDDPKPVAGNGSLVFHLIHRTKSASGQVNDKELKQWMLSPDEVAKSIAKERFGLFCHRIEIFWNNVKIPSSGVFIQAEFVTPDQKVIRSKPLHISTTSVF